MSVTAVVVRDAAPGDLAGIAAVDTARGGRPKPEYWENVLGRYVRDSEERVALVALGQGGEISGYLFGEVRAWEFGSDRCGWIFAVAVDPRRARESVATELCHAAMRQFHKSGVRLVRTMVRRGDVPILAFFRSIGFVAGPFSEMEKVIDAEDLEGLTA